MAHAARFWDRIADGYAKRPVADPDAYRRKLAMTQRYLGPDMEVLELGCGTGTTALKHAPFVNHILAVDISSKMIDIGSAKAADAGVSNVTFTRSSVEDLLAADESYEVIMAHSLLHLVGDRAALIAEIRRMLKPGGHFISSTACLGGVMPWLRVVLPIGHALGLLPQVRFFTPSNLLNGIENAGFRIDHQWQPGPKQGLFIIARKA